MTNSTLTHGLQPIVEQSLSQPDPFSRAVERSAAELQVGRKLGKLANSIASFFDHQMLKLERKLAEVQSWSNRDEKLRREVTEFIREKAVWKQEQQAELQRLADAGDRLIDGWRQLEIQKIEVARRETLNQLSTRGKSP